jgi:ATP/maltotriose-dependent transcriptional regulator MalT
VGPWSGSRGAGPVIVTSPDGWKTLAARRTTLPASSFEDFGTLLRALRLRARLTQRELGLQVGYSEAQISRLEQGKRLPDPAVVAALFLQALGLSEDPDLATRLQDLAKAARAQAQSAQAPTPAHGLALPPPGPRDAAGSGQPWPDPEDLVAIPPPPEPSVDRAGTAARLRTRLASQSCVMLCGQPGVGKTALAGTLARERAEQGPVCWLTLTAGITTPAEAVIRRLARFLARHGEADVAPLADPGPAARPLPRDEQLFLLTGGLNRTGALIVLDNAHLLAAEPDSRAVVEHLVTSSRAQILAVSREEPSLPGFDVIRLNGLGHDEALRLIGSLDGEPLAGPVAERLIERTDGSPMLIRLALGQAQAGDLDPATLVDRLEAQPAVTGYLLQTTLAGLGAGARRLLDQLAVFRHPVDLLDDRLVEAGEELDGPFDVLGGLDELRRRQLINHAAQASLHPLVHDHAYTALAGNIARRRKLHLVAARHCEQALTDPLEAAWHYARAARPAEAADLIIGATLELIARGRSARAAEFAQELLQGGQLADDTERLLLVARGDLLMHTEHAADADAAYRQALARSGSPAIRADVAWRLAQSLQRRSQVAEALALCQEAAAELTEGQDVLRAMLTAVQAGSHLMLSQYPEAQAAARDAAALADKIAAVAPGMTAEVRARAFVVLGITARLAGQPRQAQDWLRQSVAAAESAGRGTPVGQALLNLAAIAHEAGDTARAEQLYEEARAKLLPVGDVYGLAAATHGLAGLRHQNGDPEKALEALAEAVALRRRIGDLQGTSSSEHAQALALLSLGRVAEARTLLSGVLDATAALGERRNRAHFVDSMAMIELAAARPDAAAPWLAEAARMAGTVGEPSLRVIVTAHRALAALAAGDLAAAGPIVAEAAQIAADAGISPSAQPGLEHLAVAACLAIARGQTGQATGLTARLARDARASGWVLLVRAAEQLAAAGRDPAAPPDPASYPRLLWVVFGT